MERKIGVVMTGGNNDPEDWKEIIGTKSHKEELARKFKDNDDPMKIAIVVDMWLTGLMCLRWLRCMFTSQCTDTI